MRILAWPEPYPRALALELNGPCDRVELRIYSAALNRVVDLRGPGCGRAGWIQASLGGMDLPAGLYYVWGQSYARGRPMGPPVRTALVVLH